MSRRADLSPAQRAKAFSKRLDEKIARGHRQLRPGETPHIGPLAAIGDAELITSLLSVGMPLVNARAIEHNAQQRFLALRVWFDIDQAGKGDAGAKERVDMLKAKYQELRRDELIRG